jgi:hypothetical protein
MIVHETLSTKYIRFITDDILNRLAILNDIFPAIGKIYDQDKQLNKMIITTVTSTKRFNERVLARLLSEGLLPMEPVSLIELTESDKEIESKIFQIYEEILLEEMEKEKQKLLYLYTESTYSMKQKTKNEQLDLKKDKRKSKGAYEYLSIIVKIAELAMKVYENIINKKKTAVIGCCLNFPRVGVEKASVLLLLQPGANLKNKEHGCHLSLS